MIAYSKSHTGIIINFTPFGSSNRWMFIKLIKHFIDISVFIVYDLNNQVATNKCKKFQFAVI